LLASMVIAPLRRLARAPVGWPHLLAPVKHARARLDRDPAWD
jgi:hypothetical protein